MELKESMIKHIMRHLDFIYSEKESDKLTLSDDSFASFNTVKIRCGDVSFYVSGCAFDDNKYCMISFREPYQNHILFYYNLDDDKKEIYEGLTRPQPALYWLPLSIEQLSQYIGFFEKIKFLDLEKQHIIDPDIFGFFISALKQMEDS